MSIALYICYIKMSNMKLQSFTKKPITITAALLTVENIHDVAEWANSIQPDGKKIYIQTGSDGAILGLSIPTKEGYMLCSIGDYLIQEPFPTDDRMFYPCKPDMLMLTYDENVTVEEPLKEEEEVLYSIRECLEGLEEPYKSQAIENVISFRADIDLKYRTVLSSSDALAGGFDWGMSPQGFQYWHDVMKNQIERESNAFFDL